MPISQRKAHLQTQTGNVEQLFNLDQFTIHVLGRCTDKKYLQHAAIFLIMIKFTAAGHNISKSIQNGISILP